LIIPNDANIIKDNLQEFRETNHIPQSLKENVQSSEYFQKRYDSSIKWIETNNHAVISNGPFYLESYSPESRTIKVSAFDDDSYPFKKGKWTEFEKAEFPSIKKIDMKKIIQQGEELAITIETENADSILYFLTNSQGEKIASEIIKLKEKDITINITSNNTKELEIGTNSIKIFAVSNSVLKPDFIKSSFIVTDNKVELPVNTFENVQFSKNDPEYWIWIIPVIVIAGILIYLKKKN
jgi:peptide/nickel transport system substrate-binding protein